MKENDATRFSLLFEEKAFSNEIEIFQDALAGTTDDDAGATAVGVQAGAMQQSMADGRGAKKS